MESALKSQPFYENLNSETKNILDEIIKMKKKNGLVNRVTTYVYIAIGIVFLYFFKDVMFQKNYMINMDTLFFLCKIFVVIGASISITDVFSKKSIKDLEKAKNKLKRNLVFDVCTCHKKCRCKADLIDFLNNYDIKII